MIKDFFEKLTQIFKTKDLRNKIFFIFALLIVFRLAANIPLPGIDVAQIKDLFAENQLVGLLNMFSGGGLSNISIVLLGLGPYITASIIMQLLTMIVPRMEQLHKEEGEQGRQKFNSITRMLTVPLAIMQTFAMVTLLKSQGIITQLSSFDMVLIIIVATAGTIFLMWLGELITEKKIGNGVSIMIFAGIVASLPTMISQTSATFDERDIYKYILFAAVGILTIVGVVFVSEGQRNIPISYAKRMRGNQSYGQAASHLPLRVNQAGVIPIIFAVSLILFPTMVGGMLAQASNESLASFGQTLTDLFQNQWIYGIVYFSLVVLFTYFYTAVVFDPHKIAENLQKQGGYVPGVRPGSETEEYLGRIVTRITLAGALFLGTIAVMPVVVSGVTGMTALTIGGTSILITVSVVIEIVKQLEAQMVMRDYDGF